MTECKSCSMAGNLKCDFCENWICYEHTHLYEGKKLCRECLEKLVSEHVEDYVHTVALYHPEVDAAIAAAVNAALEVPAVDVFAAAIADLERQATSQPELSW